MKKVGIDAGDPTDEAHRLATIAPEHAKRTKPAEGIFIAQPLSKPVRCSVLLGGLT
jgi:hypothetical protein